MDRKVIDGKRDSRHIQETYWSLAEYAEYAAKHAGKALHTIRQNSREFTGVDSMGEAVTLAKHGWHDELDETLALAESAVKTADSEHMMDTFQPTWDVTGAEVDVARYLSGEPECMIDFPLSKTSKSGRVVTLVASRSASGAVESDTLIRRGRVIVALALALNQLGHAVEIWADFAQKGIERHRDYQRVLLKGAGDELDPAQIMFGMAHPAMLRALKFGATDGYPDGIREAMQVGYGTPAERTGEDSALYPEGTIFLPHLLSAYDVPDADTFLRKYLGELGLLAE